MGRKTMVYTAGVHSVASGFLNFSTDFSVMKLSPLTSSPTTRKSLSTMHVVPAGRLPR